MEDILRYVAAERQCQWRGHEFHLRIQEHKLFTLLHRHHGHWISAIRIEPILWPAQSPDTWRNIITQIATDLASHLIGTSCHIERHKDSKVYGLGYRLVGKVDWIEDEINPAQH